MKQSYRALTIRQPWAQLIVDGIKPIENRTWITDYRGPILIHAGLYRDPTTTRQYGYDPDELTYGAVIGTAELIGIVPTHPSRFYEPGKFAWVLANPKRVRPIPMRGKLTLFNVSIEPQTLEQVT